MEEANQYGDMVSFKDLMESLKALLNFQRNLTSVRLEIQSDSNGIECIEFKCGPVFGVNSKKVAGFLFCFIFCKCFGCCLK